MIERIVDWIVLHPGVFIIGWSALSVLICVFIHKVHKAYDGRDR